MGIQLNGTSGTDVISAVDGSLTVEGLTISGDFNVVGHSELDNVNVAGILTAVSDGNAGVVLHRTFSGNVSGATNTPQLDFTLTDTATSNQVVAKISPQALAGTGDAFKGNLRFFTANDAGTSTERLRIASDGKLAIGNVSPQQLLHVWPDAADTSTAYIRVTAGDRNSNTGLDLGHDASGNGHVNMVSNGTLTFSTNGSPRIKIANNSAATAIGTNAAYNAMLTVRGDISGQLLHLKATEDTSRLMVSGTDANGVEINLYDAAGGQKGILGVSSGEFFIKAPNSGAPMGFYTHNGSSIGLRLKINSAGDILLGTDQATIGCNTADGSDNRSFSLCGGSDASQNRGSIVTIYGNEANDGHSRYGSLYLRSGNTSTGIIGLWTQGNERLSITPGGNVNIGGNYTQTTYVCEVSGAYNKHGMRIVSGAPNYNDPLVVSTSTGGERFRIKGDGDIVATGNLKTNNLPGNNLIHNGEFAIWQRGTTSIYSSQNKYLADRFKFVSSSDGNGSVHQHTNVPTIAQTGGSKFAYSLRLNCTTADTSLANNQYINLSTRIEGRDLRHLGFGQAGTRYATLSFWQRSPNGTYHVSFRNNAYNRYYIASYTAANNTWEKHELTIPIDTSGTWTTDHSAGVDITWSLGGGSWYNQGTVGSWQGGSSHAGSSQKNFFDTVGNDFYITGVQFEKGTIATPFEHKSYGEDLRICQRYFFTITPPVGFINATEDLGMAFASSANEVQFPIKFPVEMRATPSVEQVPGSNYFRIGQGNLGGDKYISGSWIVNNMSPNCGNLYTDPDSNLSSYIGQAATIQLQNTSARLALKSEL